MPSTTLEVPQYFRDRWQEKEGWDPIAMQEQGRKRQKVYAWFFLSALGGLLIGMGTLAVKSKFPHPPGILLHWGSAIAWVALVTITLFLGMLAQAIGEKCRDKYDRFVLRLTSLAECLRLTPEELFQLADQHTLTTTAEARLKGITNYISAIEDIPGSEAGVTVEGLRRKLKHHFDEFMWWGLIPLNAKVGNYFPAK